MADWPELEEFKQVVNINQEADRWATTLDRVLAAAISRVKSDVGNWDDLVDEPDEALAQAALRMAELIAQRPEIAGEGTNDPTYMRLIYGHRRRFGIS